MPALGVFEHELPAKLSIFTTPKGICAAAQCQLIAEVPRLMNSRFRAMNTNQNGAHASQTTQSDATGAKPENPQHACGSHCHSQVTLARGDTANRIGSVRGRRTSAAAEMQAIGSTSLQSGHRHSRILCMPLPCRRIALRIMPPPTASEMFKSLVCARRCVWLRRSLP